MQSTQTPPQFNAVPAEFTPTFNVVIAYEDFEAGKQAMTTYDFLARHLGSECRCFNQMWKFEVLGIPKLREMAASDAMSADMLIIACGKSKELPAAVKQWLEETIKGGIHAFGVVFLYSKLNDTGGDQLGAAEFLAQFARRGAMEFFAQSYRPPVEPYATTADVDLSILPALGQSTPLDDCYPRWGINE